MRATLSKSLLAALALSSCAAAPSAPLQNYGRFQTTIWADYGNRTVDSSFDPANHQKVYGAQVDIRQPGSDKGLVIGLHHSSDSGTKAGPVGTEVEVSSSTTDLSVGARWKGQPFWGNFRAFFSTGLAGIYVDYSAEAVGGDSSSDSAWSVGPYIEGGLEWALGDHLSLGVAYRRLIYTDKIKGIDINDQRTDANFGQLLFSVGYLF